MPARTQKKILAAARALNYRPNFFARSLRLNRTYTIGVIVEEIGDPYGSMIISGVERYLRKKNFFFLTVAHRHDEHLLSTYGYSFSHLRSGWSRNRRRSSHAPIPC